MFVHGERYALKFQLISILWSIFLPSLAAWWNLAIHLINNNELPVRARPCVAPIRMLHNIKLLIFFAFSHT